MQEERGETICRINTGHQLSRAVHEYRQPIAKVRWTLFVLLVLSMSLSTLETLGVDIPTLEKAEREYLLDRKDGYTQIARRVARVNRENFMYGPAILTLAAGIASRLPDRGPSGAWRRELLPWPSEVDGRPSPPAFYYRPVPVHVRWVSPKQKRVFIIFGSSYSTWERGTWTNLAVELLRQQFHEPQLMVFAGFLTPEFLNLRSRNPALTTAEPARDLYVRLRAAIAEWKRSGRLDADSQVGLVGFSGGASLVISLLAEDSRHGGPLLFDRGGIAFSPVLDLPISFQVLDGANKLLNERSFPPSRALTTPLFPDALLALLRGYTPSNPAPFLRLTSSNSAARQTARRRETIGRFYREFQRVDLATTSKASYTETPTFRIAAEQARKEDRLNYGEYYRRIVFECLQPGHNFERGTRIEPELERIRRVPIYLVFAQDDPVLSQIDPELAGSKLRFPSRLQSIVKFAKGQPNMRVFNPIRGAHMGYFLDRNYLQGSLAGFFGGSAPRK
jgi:hypothetical protein